jgi:hypothetical protein
MVTVSITAFRRPNAFSKAWRRQGWQPLVLGLLLLTLGNQAWSKTLSASTERTQVELGDIIELHLQADFQSPGSMLDLSPLEDQFEVLGSQRSNQIQLVNGQMQSSTRWLIQLLPKHSGELIIPPLSLQQVQSQPLPLSVKPLPKGWENGTPPAYFLQAEVGTETPYVQAQVLYTLRFYYQGRFISGNIRPPEFGNAHSELLQDGLVYHKQLHDQTYTVHEWLYALYPQSSGTLEISPASFNGRLQLKNQLKQLQESSQALALKVLPAPDDFTQHSHTPWLPAQTLRLTSQWQLPATEIRVGDTLTQTLTLEVEGQMAHQLPDLPLPTHPDFKVYADQPQSQQHKQVNGIRSIKQFKRALVPTQPGTITLPQQTLYWWDTRKNALQSAVIEAQTWTVLPASPPANGPAMPTQAPQPPDKDTVSHPPFQWLWPALSAGFALLWLGTLGLWWQARRTPPCTDPSNREQDAATPTTQPAANSLSALCQLEPANLYAALKPWLHDHRHIEHFSQLPEGALKQGIVTLEAALFANGTFSPEDRRALCDALKEKVISSPSQTEKNALAPLYRRS